MKKVLIATAALALSIGSTAFAADLTDNIHPPGFDAIAEVAPQHVDVLAAAENDVLPETGADVVLTASKETLVAQPIIVASADVIVTNPKPFLASTALSPTGGAPMIVLSDASLNGVATSSIDITLAARITEGGQHSAWPNTGDIAV